MASSYFRHTHTHRDIYEFHRMGEIKANELLQIPDFGTCLPQFVAFSLKLKGNFAYIHRLQ